MDGKVLGRASEGGLKEGGREWQLAGQFSGIFYLGYCETELDFRLSVSCF